MRRGQRRDEELRAVGVGPGVGHGQQAGLVVCQLEVLVLELVPVDAVAPVPVTSLKVSALKYENSILERKFI